MVMARNDRIESWIGSYTELLSKKDIKIKKVEAELSALQDVVKGHEIERDQLLKEIKDNSSYRNSELEKEILALQEENKKLREALEYYADKDNWTYSELITLEGDNGEAIFYTEIKDDDKFEIGGRRARKALEAK